MVGPLMKDESISSGVTEAEYSMRQTELDGVLKTGETCAAEDRNLEPLCPGKFFIKIEYIVHANLWLMIE